MSTVVSPRLEGASLKLALGAFLVAHGLVHLLYLGQSLHFIELKPGLSWPAGAWALPRSNGERAPRLVAAVLLSVAAAGFVVAGPALALGQAWWQAVGLSAAVVSTACFLLLWNGRLRKLGEQGLYAIVINAVLLAAVIGFGWPDVGT